MTEYLLDVQPGLFVTLAETAQGNTKRFIHGPRGVHALQDNAGAWAWMVQDGLNTVRGQVTAGLVNDVGVLDVQAVREVSPYGVEESSSGAFETAYHFTGEPRDANGLSYLRARYLNSELGIFASLDPIEFINRYTYVSDNPINFADPLGLFDTTTCTVEYGDYLEKIAIEHGICVLPASPEGMQRLEFSPNCPRGWGAVTNRSYNQDKINAWRRIGNLNPHLESPSLIYPGVRLFLPSNRDQVCEYRLAPIPDELVYVPPRPPVCDEYVDFPVLHGFTTPRSLPRSPATPVPIPLSRAAGEWLFRRFDIVGEFIEGERKKRGYTLGLNGDEGGGEPCRSNHNPSQKYQPRRSA